MSSNSAAGGRAGAILLAAVITELTAATALIHFSLGATHFLLNGLGYSVLGAAYVIAVLAPIPIVQRFGWLPRVGLAAFALVTIGAYLVIGPHFTLGWATKAIEAAIVGLVVFDLAVLYRGQGDRGRLVERVTVEPATGSGSHGR
jgi:hypothetical protein